MKLMFKSIWGVIPVPIFVTDWGMGPTVGGAANGPVVRIRPKYIANGDVGIVNHELNHDKQFYTSFLISLGIFAALWLWLGYFSIYSAYILIIGGSLHSFLYLLVRPYKLWSEVTSYQVQAKHYANYNEKLQEFAGYISKYYNLNISQNEALLLLKKS